MLYLGRKDFYYSPPPGSEVNFPGEGSKLILVFVVTCSLSFLFGTINTWCSSIKITRITHSFNESFTVLHMKVYSTVFNKLRQIIFN